jgi:hypothetical protein
MKKMLQVLTVVGSFFWAVAFAEPGLVQRQPGKRSVLPAECNKRETADLTLPAWQGKLAITNMPWDAIIASVATDPEVAKRFASWTAQAEKWAADPVIQRPRNLKEVEAANWLDPRCKNMTGWQKENFALALASGRPWMALGRKLPMAAMVVRQSGEPKAIDYLNRQLTECATWFPFQVQGWTLTGSSSPSVKDDGPWLADCYAMVTLGLTMSMAADRLDPQVKSEIRKIIQKEIDWIARAWKEKIPWYVRSQACGSNQWALPAAALVLGCMILEDDKNREAYELGVNALARHLCSQGQSGSFVEGYGYASMTMEYMLPVLWMMARNGDLRLNENPYLKNYASWFHQMNLPGKRVINHSDSGRIRYSIPQRQILLASLLSEKLSDLWALDTFYSYVDSGDIFSQIYLAEVKKRANDRPELPRYAWFADQQLAVWRTGWSDTDMAVWLKGGTQNDHHCHIDQGHLSVMNGTEDILQDPLTLHYGDPDYLFMSKSCAGHNILQAQSGRMVGNLRRGRAPVNVERLDENGGVVAIDGSEIMPEVRNWQRRIEWKETGFVAVQDHATLFEIRPAGEEWFRWHTGSLEQPKIEIITKEKQVVSWGSNRLELTGNRTITVDTVPWRSAGSKRPHYCVVVKTDKPGDSLNLSTTLSFPRLPKTAIVAAPYTSTIALLQSNSNGKVIRIEAESMTLPTGETCEVISNIPEADKAVKAWTGLQVELDIPEGGWYCLAARYSARRSAVRKYTIDGKIPFSEAESLLFPPTEGESSEMKWTYAYLGETAQRQAFFFHLSKGRHQLALADRAGGEIILDYLELIPAGEVKGKTIQTGE